MTRSGKPDSEALDSNTVEFRRALVPVEIDALCDVDRRIFHAHPSDLFPREFWAERCEAYWMTVNGQIVGCSAFQLNNDHRGEKRGCLYISSTGILPEFRRRGLGRKQKEWQIEYARKNGYSRIVTNMRASNAAIIALNKSVGFTVHEIVATGMYDSPDEPAVVMELTLDQLRCPHCGKPLRTPRAKQCRFCRADWH